MAEQQLEELLNKSPWKVRNNREYQDFQFEGKKYMRWRNEPRRWILRDQGATPRTIPDSQRRGSISQSSQERATSQSRNTQGGVQTFSLFPRPNDTAESPSNPGSFQLSSGGLGSGPPRPSSPPKGPRDLLNRSKDDRSVVPSIEPELTANRQQGAPKDERYYTRPDAAKFFTEGRIFKVWWPEPAGRRGLGPPRSRAPKDKNPQDLFDGYRRMAVVRWRKGYCICIPITTYSFQGVAKSGLTPEDRRRHAVIYMTGESYRESEAERGMIVKKPIMVKPANPQQKLDRMSRIHFGRPQTIAWNVDVLNIGKVSDSSLNDFLEYYAEESGVSSRTEGQRSPPNKNKDLQNLPRQS